MEGWKMARIGRIGYAGLAMALVSTPAFAQEGGGLDLVEMFESMGPVAIAIAVVLFIMSFWSVGVAIERIYTFSQAKKQSKLYAPQVAKHLKEGRLKEAIALSSAKEYRYSHLAKVVLAGLQEYQFQHDSAGGEKLNREDLLDTVRRAIQRATALTGNDLKKGVSALATILFFGAWHSPLPYPVRAASKFSSLALRLAALRSRPGMTREHTSSWPHFDAVMRERFIPSGRVTFMPMCEYEGDIDGSHLVRSITSGATRNVDVRRQIVEDQLIVISCSDVPDRPAAPIQP